MDTDDYFWEQTDIPYTVKRDVSERISLMRRNIEKYGNVVISGSLIGWGDVLIPMFTLAIRVKTDTAVRIERLKMREKEQLGVRIEPGGDMYEHHLEFIEWAASYDTGGGGLGLRSKAAHDEWEKQLQCLLVEVDGGKPVEENCAIIKEKL